MNTSDIIYLDYAAATPMSDHVIAAMQPYFAENFYNPSSPYAPAVQVRRDYEAVKQRLARTFGAKGEEIIITAGATESINLTFHDVTGHVVTSSIEHPAVLEAAKQHDHTLVPPNDKGLVELETIKTAIRPDTQLISISLANSELGTIQPIRAISSIVTDERQARAEKGNVTPLLFHCDASQGVGQLDVHVARLGVDLLTLNAAKMYGPKQVGLLWTKHTSSVAPYIVGGGQERGLRSGTENVAGVIGFAAAAEWVSKHRATETKRLGQLRDTLQTKLTRAFPNAKIIGSEKHRLASHLSIAFGQVDAERIIFLLETHGVLVATGSACSANKHTASHVLRAIGLDEEYINGSLRMTLGKQTTSGMIERASQHIISAVTSEYERIGAA